MKCYGLPSHFLSIKEYGGLSHDTTASDNWFEFNAYSFALKFDPDDDKIDSSKYLEIEWNSNDIRCVEMCFKLNKTYVSRIINDRELNNGFVEDLILMETNTWRFCLEFDEKKKMNTDDFILSIKI